MARVIFLLFLLPLLSHLLLTITVSTSGSDGMPDILLPSVNPKPEHGKMRAAQIQFYWHDTVGGPNPTAVAVARSAIESSTKFGTIRVMDDPITTTSDRSSLVIGMSQGMYISADKAISGLFMAMTITFTAGEYAGSSFTVVGRNTLRTPEREMPIIGGTGQFRNAKGYVRVRTHSYDATIGYTVVEYSCYFNTLI